MNRKEQILKNISLKRKYRYEKKINLLENPTKNKIKTKEIGIQTDEIKKENIKLDIETHELINIKPEVNFYKKKFFGNLVGLNSININENKNFMKYHLNKIHDEINCNIVREKEIFIFDNNSIILKIDINNQKIKISLLNEKIEKIIDYKRNTKFTLIKNKINKIKINDINLFNFKKEVNYYLIK